MHKCINNSVGNVYHLEQLVGDFFPYSQKKLGFDQDVTIVFQSDEDNAQRALGKTAYYSPENYEIILYTDGRHPKDIMRSLSHELVHHDQNCRGDFTNDSVTDPGYAQQDPHLRKMEREAYTKGNLIFRDYEDLIKAGKKEVDIDFSKTGEPKMSLKEWKNNEINQKLMQKWGLLKERAALPIQGDGTELEEGHEHGPECGCPDQELEEGGLYRDDDLDASSEERLAYEKDPVAKANLGSVPGLSHGAKGEIMFGDEDSPERGAALKQKRQAFAKQFKEGKISVKEAKEITRRVVERLRKEGK